MMTQLKRQMIQIDEEKCDGCGQCLPSCPEGALQIVAGKARLVRASYCDGLGACLGGCPNGALQVLEMEAEAYDEAGVIAHLQATAPARLPEHVAHLKAHAPELLLPSMRSTGQAPDQAAPMPAMSLASGQSHAPAACPSAALHFWQPETVPIDLGEPARPAGRRSELRQWPVQLQLLPPTAPFFQGAALTLIADCVPFAYPDLHTDFIKGSAIAIGCPKLDDANGYVEKVTQILQANDVRSLRVIYMEVPCCRGLVWIAEQALQRSGKSLPFATQMLNIRD